MFELVLSFVLEVVLLLLVILFAIVYLKSKMESIWGEWVEDSKKHQTLNSTGEDTDVTSIDHFILGTEIPDFQDTSSDDEEFQLKDHISENIDLIDCSADKHTSTEYLVSETSDEEFYATEILKIHEYIKNCNPIYKIFIQTIEDTIPDLNISPKPKVCEESEHKYIVNIPKFININDTSREVKILDSVKMDWYYDVNGALFTESEGNTKYDVDTVEEYVLYKVDTVGGDDWTPLEIRVQQLSQGVLVNSNVVLQPAHWNCIVPVDNHLVRCAVCQMYCDNAASEHHMQTASHRRNLHARAPLRKYDLAVVRKIDSNLHCGVCNEIVDEIDFRAHENKKSHEENLLKAINKVSDLAEDAQWVLPDRQTDGRNNTLDGMPLSMSNTPTSTTRSTHINNTSQSKNMTGNSRSVTEVSRNTPESRNVGEYHFNAKALNNMCNDDISVYEQFSEDEEEDLSEEEEERVKVGIQEGIMRGFYPPLADEEIEEYKPPVPGFSYASMAKKPVIQLPKFLKIDLGSKMFRVRHDSWHMVTALSSNQYYCMACRAREHIARKPAHCTDVAHERALARCAVLRAYQEHLVRQVDDKLAHCAHCNTLQVQDEMKQHLLARHPSANRNYVETAGGRGAVIQPQKTESDKSGIIDKRLDFASNPTRPELHPNFNIFGDITISPFGCLLKIPVLNFNLIQKRGEEYYCVLCEAVCPDVQEHVEDLRHVELMTMVPYIKPFHNNLTRAVRGTLHCSLCNEVVSAGEVRDHNLSPPHTSALAAAFGMHRARLPDHISAKVYKPNFLSSQPPPLPPPKPLLNEPPVPLLKTTNAAKVISPSVSPSPDGINKTKTDQNIPFGLKLAQTTGQNLDYQREAHDYQNILRSGEGGPSVGQNVLTVRPTPQPAQNIPIIRPNILNAGQNTPIINTQAIKSIPLLFNPMFPRAAPPPFGHYLSPTNSPNTLSPSQSMRNINCDPSFERKTLIITDKNDTKDEKDSNTGSTISGSDKTGEVAKSGTGSRCDSEGSKTDSSGVEETNSESEDEDKYFDEEEMVFVKFKNNYFKITNSSYHSLLFLDKGLRYCFVCSTRVLCGDARAHVTSKKHVAALQKNQFLDKNGLQLYRQMYLVYQCAVCNAVVPGGELRRHAAWPPHADAYAQQHVDPKRARRELKAGALERSVGAQREAVYRNARAPHEPRVIAAYRIVRATPNHANTATEGACSDEAHVKKNKMVIHNDVVMVLSFEQWHSISYAGGLARCALCLLDMSPGQVWEHIASAEHVAALATPVETAHLPALIRRIDASSVQCMTCNVALTGAREHVAEHAAGRRHAVAVRTAQRAQAYTDCYADCLVL